MSITKEELKQAVASAAQEIGTSPGLKSSFSELIVETIEPNRLTLDFFSAFMPVRQLNVGDSLMKRVRNRGFPVRTLVPGTQHLADQFGPPREIMTYAIDYLIAKTAYNFWELRRAELGTIEDFRRRMEDAIIDKLVERVFTLIGSTWTAVNTPNNYVTVSSAITETVLEDMIETILEEAGQVKAIVGTRKALLPIYKFAGVTEWTISDGTSPTNTTPLVIQKNFDQWHNTGRVTSFRGVQLIELPQVYERTIDNYDKKLIKEDEIHVIGDNAGEIILYGGIESQEHTNTAVEPPEYTLAIWRGYSMMIDAPENIGIIKIT